MIKLGAFEYDPRAKLGRGQFGTVYRGNVITKPTKEVAIKLIVDSRDMPVSYVLKREISLLQALQHPNIVKLYAYFIQENGRGIHIIMELCNGGDFAAYIKAKRPLPIKSIRIILQQVASALNEMNKLKIIHRDLKPANILLCHCRNCGKLSVDLPIEALTFKIGDFGLARVLKRNEMAATICGSPVYMAPEIYLNKPYDAKADMWSLGAIMFECLTGKLPFSAATMLEMAGLFRTNPGVKVSIPPGTDNQLGQLLSSMLAYYPTDRPDFDQLLEHPFLTKPSTQNQRKQEAFGPPSPHIIVNAKPPTTAMVIPMKPRRSKDDLWDIPEPRRVHAPCEYGFREAISPAPPLTRLRSNSLGRLKDKCFEIKHKRIKKLPEIDLLNLQNTPNPKTRRCHGKTKLQNPCTHKGICVKHEKKLTQK